MVRFVPVPSSKVNCKSFLDFLTASQASTLTARKSLFEKVSKSTISSNIGSTLTLEKSMISGPDFASATASTGAATASVLTSFDDFTSFKGFIVGMSVEHMFLSSVIVYYHDFSTA